MARRAHKCRGKCIFIKKSSVLVAKGRWRLVFSSCKGDCKCPKRPPDKAGKIGDVFQSRCCKASDAAGGAVNCHVSCQFHMDQNGNWVKDLDCGIATCSCANPPGGVGAPGDNYATDCLPTSAARH
jgi:hypothetical protein